MSDESNAGGVDDSGERIVRNDEKGRYEVWVGDSLAGITAFQPAATAGEVIFPHTVIGDEFEGRGLGGRLVKYAMEDAAARGETVVPECSFVRRWLSQHEVAGLSVREPTAGDLPA